MQQWTLSRFVAWGFGASIGLLVAGHIVGQMLRYFAGLDDAHWFVRHIKMNNEGELQTWYSVFAICWAAILLIRIAVHYWPRRRWFALGWLGLSVAFWFLAVDEGFAVHELVSSPTKSLLGAENVPHYAWVVPYGFGTAIFALGYVRFLLALDKTARWHFVAAGLVFCSGAIGLELIGSYLIAVVQTNGPIYDFAVIVEESLEMIGIAIFVWALLTYLERNIAQWAMQPGRRPDRPTVEHRLAGGHV